MINVRPKQIHAPDWPWKNRVIDGRPTVVEREPYPWMPELIGCYNWNNWEYQEIGVLGKGYCTRDMKSIFTTAVRMFGIEGLYWQLKQGNNVFGLIGAEMLRWTKHLLWCSPVAIDAIVIGDDLAHNRGSLFAPKMLTGLFRQYEMFYLLAGENHVDMVFHSDGDLSELWESIPADMFLVEKRLNPQMDEPNVFDNSDPETEWNSYPVREME